MLFPLKRTMARIAGASVLAALLQGIPVAAQQNATVQGTVVDESRGAMPGATVTLTEVNTGRQTVGVTLEDGRYRFENVAPGLYRLRFELQGFATQEMTNLELLVGANATVPPITLTLASLQEVITVTSQAPLVDLRSSQVTGNVDRRQMAELPLLGRNWTELALLVKGVTANSAGNTPGAADDQFQLNLDGQQITQRVAGSGFGQPKVSREAIAEFQIITNQFDITQGRSTGMQVQAISRSGTNQAKGSAYGYFRSDTFNAADPISHTVLPFENQQIGGTLGGPIVLNQVHYFGSFEYERQPADVFLRPTRLPNQSFQFETKPINKNYLVRVDMRGAGADTYTFRGQRWAFTNPFSIGSGTAHPSTADNLKSFANNYSGTWTRVIHSNLTMQVQGGVNKFSWYNEAQSFVDVPFHQTPYFVPEISFPGLTLGGASNYPNNTWQNTYSGRIDVNSHTSRHDSKWGLEFLRVRDTKEWSLNRRGTYVFNTRPSDAELERRFPADAWNDPSRWDISGLEPHLQRFDINFNPDYLIDTPRPTLAVWFGDNWRVTDSLSVNLGVRWDADWGATNPPYVSETEIWIDNGFEPRRDFGYKVGIRDLNNVAPRAGFAYNVGGNGDLVIRGGTGIYYNTPVSNVTYSHQYFNRSVAASLTPDGPGFMESPTRGVSAEDYLSGRVKVPQAPRVIADDYVMPWSWQSAIGFQKQLGASMGFDVDLTALKEYSQVIGRDPNLFYDPVTGYNLDPARFGRPNPDYAQLQWMESTGRTETVQIASSFNRRFRNNFQGGLTYTLMLSKKDNTTGFGIQSNNQFNLMDDYQRSSDFQRHTIRANWIVNLPMRFAFAGSFFYGSGNYRNASISGRPYGKPGTNRLNIGPPITIPDATMERWEGPQVIETNATWPKNALHSFPLHKVDVRLSKSVRVLGRLSATLQAEMFNVMNWRNYGGIQTQLDSPLFGQPTGASGAAYAPRTGQLGIRVDF